MAVTAQWYVIHVYSGFEKKVAQSIEEQARQSGMEDNIDQVLVPVEEVVEMRRGSKVNAERKFFPGYVLVKMDMTDETWHLVKNTPKVAGFLGGRGRPTPISDAEADRIIHQVRGGNRASQAFGDVRGRRAGSRLRRTVHVVQRSRRGCGRGTDPAQGRGVDIWAFDAR